MQEVPQDYRYGLIPDIIPIQPSPWADEDQIARTPTPDDVVTWMEGTLISELKTKTCTILFIAH